MRDVPCPSCEPSCETYPSNVRVLYGLTVIGLCRCISPLERLRILTFSCREGRHLDIGGSTEGICFSFVWSYSFYYYYYQLTNLQPKFKLV